MFSKCPKEFSKYLFYKNKPILIPLHWARFSPVEPQSMSEIVYTSIRETKQLTRMKCFLITTVFVDTRLWKTKHLRKRFQKFPSIIRVIDMSDRNPPITAR